MSRFSKTFDALTPREREVLARRLERARLHEAASRAPEAAPTPVSRAAGETHNPPAAGEMKFSLFFFSDEGAKATGEKYRLLLDCARYADEHGFTAVWTPERHFQDFGGLYPNPSVLSAALAMVTRRIQIRAGSVALPLHHPIRVAEEWSLVDNLSGGRVGVSFASGWHPVDFVLSPSAYRDRRRVMFEHIETIRKLWAGDAVKFPGVDGGEVEIKILPRPVQEKLPVWITTSGSFETWVKAGEIGANVLAAFNGSDAHDLAKRIAAYRESLAKHGHEPGAGQVAVMLHTYVGEDIELIKEQVRTPITNYLRTFMAQGRHADTEELGADIGGLTADDYDALAALAFEKFFRTGSLLCTPQKGRGLIDRLLQAGVNEVACLADFGLDAETVLGGLRRLNDLRECYHGAGPSAPSSGPRQPGHPPAEVEDERS